MFISESEFIGTIWKTEGIFCKNLHGVQHGSTGRKRLGVIVLWLVEFNLRSTRFIIIIVVSSLQIDPKSCGTASADWAFLSSDYVTIELCGWFVPFIKKFIEFFGVPLPAIAVSIDLHWSVRFTLNWFVAGGT